jgi:hypothetical protein
MRRDFVSVAVLVLFLVLAFGSGENNKSSKGSSSSSKPSGGGSTSEPAATPGSQWSYDNSEDAMAKGAVSQASVQSTNTVNFRFPYAGEQHGTLTLRTHPRYGKNVIFSIKKGQIQCPSYSGCTVLVRFDNGEPARYSGTGPEDNSSETVFIRDYSGFVGKMTKAKTVRISPSVYQEGAPVFEFDVTGFDAAKYRPKK